MRNASGVLTAMTGDVSYELTRQSGASDTGITRAGIGLVLRR